MGLTKTQINSLKEVGWAVIGIAIAFSPIIVSYLFS